MTPPSFIAHYKVGAKLGEGGMGAVYRATDTRLNRDVAIKLLPPAFAEDSARMQRFEREAQVLASLNHPNIAAIYGIEQGAIVMELVEGEDLHGPVPLDTAIAYARQIAAALEAAHEKGIVHRDLKPANIKVTTDGDVKLLDFGLAKASEASAAASSVSPTLSPTLSLAMTQAGMILGTAAYMAPEQARGKPVDKRADIWAFGVVLFEMLAGKQMFAGGETVTDIIAAVVTREPDWNALPAATPAHIRRLLERCLRKDPKVRLRDIGEARIALDEATPEAPASAAPKGGGWPWGWIVAGILAVAVAGMAVMMRRSPETPLLPMMRFEVDEPGAIGNTPLTALALSPDGSRVVTDVPGTNGGRQLAIRSLDQPNATLLPGTEGAASPVFSTEGQWLAFSADGKLKKLQLQGGAAIVLSGPVATNGGISWGDDGSLVYTTSIRSTLMRVSSIGGAAQPITKFDESRHEVTHRFPWLLPGGKVVLYTASSRGGMYNEADIVATELSSGRSTVLHHGGFHPMYVSGRDGHGYLMFMQLDTVFAMPMDAATLTVREPPVPILQKVAASTSGGSAQVAISRSGLLAYRNGANGDLVTLTWVDAAGKPQPLRLPAAAYAGPRISPDGRRIAYRLGTATSSDLWVYDLASGATSKLTFTGDLAQFQWSHDGRHILYDAGQGHFWVRADGSAPARDIATKWSGSIGGFTPDGRKLVVSQASGNGNHLVVIPFGDPAGDDPRAGKEEPWLSTASNEMFPAISPDGRWVAYTSAETGANQVFVRPFPGPGGKWQITTSAGSFPEWSPKGGELFYLARDNQVMAVSYSVQGEAFVRGAERVRFAHPVSRIYGIRNYSTAPDGKQMVALVEPELPESERRPRINFLVNFGDELERRFAQK